MARAHRRVQIVDGNVEVHHHLLLTGCVGHTGAT